MMKKINGILLAVLFGISLSRCSDILSEQIEGVDGWWFVGNPAFSDGKINNLSSTETQMLAFDGDVPYVAYSDYANSSKVTVMKLSGDTWEPVGSKGFSTGAARYVSIIVSNGTPYVAFADGSSSYSARLMKFNGTSWQNVILKGTNINNTSLASYNGTVYMAYTYGSAEVCKEDDTLVGGSNFTGGTAFNMKMRISNGNIYVAFGDSSGTYGGKISVMKHNGSSWAAVGTRGFSDAAVNCIDLAVDNDVPYVSYRDTANSNGATVMKYNGSSWVVVGQKNLYNNPVNYYGMSLDMYNGVPYLIAGQTGDSERRVVKWNGAQWEGVGDGMLFAGCYTSNIHNGVPYIALNSENGDLAGKASVLRYGKK